MKLAIALFAILLCPFLSKSQYFGLDWAETFDGNNWESLSIKQIDDQGNIYLAGGFVTNMDADPGPGTYSLVNGGYGNDPVVVKLDPNGNFIWAVYFDAQTNTSVGDLIVDDSNNVYVIGNLSQTMDVDPGPGVNLMNMADYDVVYIIKLDPNGNLVWAKDITATGTFDKLIYTDMSLNANGFLLTGYFEGTVDFDPGPATNFYTSGNNWNGYFLELDMSANFISLNYIDGDNLSIFDRNVVNANGDIYFYSRFLDTVDYDLGPGNYSFSTFGGGYGNSSGVFGKYDSNYNLVWADMLAGDSTSAALVLDMDLDNNQNVVAVGYIWDTLNVFPSSAAMSIGKEDTTVGIVMKLNPSGNLEWLNSFDGQVVRTLSVDVFDNGNICVSGDFEDSIDLDPGPGQDWRYVVANNLFKDAFVVTLDPNGNYIDGFTQGGWPDDDAYVTINPSDGAIIVTGKSYMDSIDYDPGPGFYYTVPADQSQTTYIQKLNSILQVNQLSSKEDFHIYPNPASNRIYLNNMEHGRKFSLISSEGILLRSYSGDFNEIDISWLSSGLYILRIETERGEEVSRFIKL